MYRVKQNLVFEWSIHVTGATQLSADLQVWADITAPDGKVCRVPAFWGGENRWHIRYASGRATGSRSTRNMLERDPW